MRKILNPFIIAFGIVFILAVTSCNNGSDKSKEAATAVDRTMVKSDRAGVDEVIVQLNGNIEKLNPMTSSEAYSDYACARIFSQLLDIDPDSFTIIPQLAVARPIIKQIEEGEYKGGLSMTFEIRPEATWDNGTPITGDDVAFSFKAIKNPQVDAEDQRPGLDFIDDVIVDPTNNRKVTLMCKGHYFLSEIQAGTFRIIPEYNYDPGKLMRKFTVKELNNPAKAAALKSNPDIIKFAKDFNSEKYSNQTGSVVGSGPYELDQWVTGQRVVLKRKANWWGDKLKSVNRDFIAGPKKIIYEIIVDINAATAALKGEKIDVLSSIKSKDYLELSQDNRMLEKYNFYKPEQLAYTYFGLNMRNPKLSDVKVRRALAYCIDVDKIIEKLSYGMATRTIGPVSPKKPYFDKDLKPIPFDIAKAAQLLDEAGWKDTDGDGIRDKVVDGKKIKLSIEVKYPGGSDVVEKMVTLIAENCKKAGIELTQAQREWTVFLKETKNHDCEMFYNSWISSPTPDDPKQIWSTESYNGGSNFVGFGDQKSDALIEAIRNETDETKRNALYKEFQQIVYDQQPYIFMYSPLNKMAIHARFKNANPSVARPGFEVNEFMLDPTFGSNSKAAKPE